MGFETPDGISLRPTMMKLAKRIESIRVVSMTLTQLFSGALLCFSRCPWRKCHVFSRAQRHEIRRAGGGCLKLPVNVK